MTTYRCPGCDGGDVDRIASGLLCADCQRSKTDTDSGCPELRPSRGACPHCGSECWQDDPDGGPRFCESCGYILGEDFEAEAAAEHNEARDKLQRTMRGGVWTPTATVVCWQCHGPEYWLGRGPVPDYAKRCGVRPLGDGERQGSCDRCGAPVAIAESIALEQRCVGLLRAAGFDASMAQTGGMCSACEVTIVKADADGEGGRWLLVTEDEGETDRVVVGLYDGEGEEPEDYETDVHPDDVVGVVRAMVAA